MRRVAYLPLESYPERYTEFLEAWSRDALEAYRRTGVLEYSVVPGRKSADRIRTGPVLDAHGRSVWALTQMADLVEHVLPHMGAGDVVWVEDLFTPGFEALPYVLDQLPPDRRPSVWTRNFAQSMDPDDFTFPMRRWMRRYEEMVHATVAGVFVASECHREMIQAACPDAPTIHVVGLPHDPETVRRVAVGVQPWRERGPRVVHTSRLDREKQPHLMLDVAERIRAAMPESEFVVCTGSTEPRSNDPTALERLDRLARAGVVRVAAGLSKADYYGILKGARVQLNTARQDFVSNTLLEASALEVPTLAPAFRSFIEELRGRRAQLYLPWEADDAAERALALLRTDDPLPDVGSPAAHHGRTINRMLATMLARARR